MPYLRRILFAFLVLAAAVLAERPHYGEANHRAEKGEEAQRQAEKVCRGFLILPNGFAVLSGLPVSSASDSARGHHGTAHAGATPADQGHTSSAPQHLMGYTHGQEIVPQEGMRCVPIGDAGILRWTVVGYQATPTVTMESLRGPLTHGSRASVAFALTIRRSGTFVDTAQVRLLARMPHHDQRMPGGHGPANDPDVRGLVAQPVGQGRYTVPTVDLTMGGPWLFEVYVQLGAETHTVYFAASIGEE